MTPLESLPSASVPLIGIPPDAVLEECDCCHELLGLAKLTWTGKQMLCAKCAESPNDQSSPTGREKPKGNL